ncbi:unnamed protein product, partial [Ectocarpus sp. 12 AP-2014]
VSRHQISGNNQRPGYRASSGKARKPWLVSLGGPQRGSSAAFRVTESFLGRQREESTAVPLQSRRASRTVRPKDTHRHGGRCFLSGKRRQPERLPLEPAAAAAATAAAAAPTAANPRSPRAPPGTGRPPPSPPPLLFLQGIVVVVVFGCQGSIQSLVALWWRRRQRWRLPPVKRGKGRGTGLPFFDQHADQHSSSSSGLWASIMSLGASAFPASLSGTAAVVGVPPPSAPTPRRVARRNAAS